MLFSVAHYGFAFLCLSCMPYVAFYVLVVDFTAIDMCGLVWPCVVLCGLVWPCMVLYGLLWPLYCLMLSFMAEYRISRGHRSKFIWSCWVKLKNFNNI